MSNDLRASSIIIGDHANDSHSQEHIVHFELSKAVAWPHNVWTGPSCTTLEQNRERIDADVEAAIVKVLEGKAAANVIEHIFEDTAGKKWKLIEPAPEPIPFIPTSGLKSTTHNRIVDKALVQILRAADELANVMATPTQTAGDVKRLMEAINISLEYLAHECDAAAVSFRALK